MINRGAPAATPIPGVAWPHLPGFMTGLCGHPVAGDFWQAGTRTCQTCTGPTDHPRLDALPGWDREALFPAGCTDEYCDLTTPHAHPVCGTCGSLGYRTLDCEPCRDARRRWQDHARVLAPQPEYLAIWRDFWLPVVTNPDGTLRIDQLARELADYRDQMDRTRDVYLAVTEERIGNPRARRRAVIDLVNERIDQAGHDALAGFLDDDDQFAVREARDVLARWKAGHGTDIHGTDRTLADTIGRLLAILDRLPADTAEVPGA